MKRFVALACLLVMTTVLATGCGDKKPPANPTTPPAGPTTPPADTPAK